MRIFTKSFVFLLLVNGISLQTQSQNNSQVVFPYQQSFDQDSLNGFDENAAAKAAISEQFIGPELKVRMYRLKREYINNRYNLRLPTAENIFNPLTAKSSVVATCVNEDFEASSPGPITGTTQIVTGWSLVAGTHTTALATNNSCNLFGCCPNFVYESAVISPTNNGGYIDPVIGAAYPIFSVFGTNPGPAGANTANPQIPGGMFGNTFFRLNSSQNNYSIEKLSKTFQVTPNNVMFKFAFINVISNGHACCDASSFKVQLINATTNSVIASTGYSVSGLSAQCNNTTWVTYYNAGSNVPATTTTALMYNPWQFNFISLLPYLGQNITIDVIASDCTAGGHYSYTYFDAQCGPMNMSVNEEEGRTVSCVPIATVSAPANMPNYLWQGPASFSSTLRTFTTNTAGNYSLTLSQSAPLPGLNAILPLNFSNVALQITGGNNAICEGQSVNLSVSGASTYTWNTGSNATNITVNPPVTTSYTVTGTSSEGCMGLAVVTQVVDACTGITQASGQYKSASLFPNPNKGTFNLTIYDNLSKPELIVSDISGKIIYKQNVQKGENTIKISGLNTGMYYYSIRNNNRDVTTGKFNVE